MDTGLDGVYPERSMPKTYDFASNGKAVVPARRTEVAVYGNLPQSNEWTLLGRGDEKEARRIAFDDGKGYNEVVLILWGSGLGRTLTNEQIAKTILVDSYLN